MKESFELEGTFKGISARLRWEDMKILGTPTAVDEYWRIENERSGKVSLGPIPGDSISDYHENPLAANCIFHEILKDAVVVSGKSFYREMTGANDPPGVVY